MGCGDRAARPAPPPAPPAARPAPPPAPPGGAAARPDAERVREYGHPFTCDEALAGQARMEARLQELRDLGVEEDVINIYVALAMGKDKTDVERMRSVDALHLKLLNTALAIWHKRHSKVWLAGFPILKKDPDATDKEAARKKQRLAQRSLALFLVALEECARNGIKVTHKYAHPTSSHMRRICFAYATWPAHVPPHREWAKSTTYRLWPLSWLFNLDRDEATSVLGVHRAYLGQYAAAGGVWSCCLGGRGS